jgi:hypothetical protein
MKIKLKRGLSSNITAITLDTGEPAFCTDTGKLYIGDGTSNVLVNPDVDTVEAANKLAIARTIKLSGDVTGSTNFDGSANVTITATVADDSHNHIISNIDGLQSALDGKVDDSQVLTNVPANAKFTDTVTTINGKTGAITKEDITALGIPAQDTVYTHPATHSADMIVDGTTNKAYTATEKNKLAGIETGANKTTIANNLTETIPGKALDATQGKALNDAVVHNTGNEVVDGAKSFIQTTDFQNGITFGYPTNKIKAVDHSSIGAYGIQISTNDANREGGLFIGAGGNDNGGPESKKLLRVWNRESWKQVWHEDNDGHTSGLDADTLDGRHDSDMVHKAGAETITGVKTFSASPVVPTPTADTHPATKKYVDDLSASDVGAVATTDIADNLTTNDATKVLSAKQGKVLAEQISTKLNANLKGVVNGVAELDEAGKVPASQLPSYVDDVLEYNNQAGFPTTGETGKIYVAKNTNKTYRWSGSGYVEISASLALGTTSSTAFRGDYGQIAYTHSQSAHAPSNAQKNSDITKAEIEAKLTGTITTHSHTVTKGDVGLGNVTNESKATMFTSPTFTGTPKTPTAAKGTNTTQIASTAYVMTALGDYIKKTDTIDGGTF